MKIAGTLLVVVFLSIPREASGQLLPEKPKITRNYAAELNTPALATPEHQRAWPIYREVLIAIAHNSPPLWRHYGSEYQRIIHHPEVIAFLKLQQPQLRRAIDASKLPHLGHILSDEHTADDIRLNARHLNDEQRKQYIAPKPQPPSENPDLMNVLLQPLGESGELFDALGAHALLSASTGDSSAAVDDIEAIFRIASHLRHIPFIVGDCYSLTRFSVGLEAWGLILERYPDALSAEQLTRLESAAQAFAKGEPLIRISRESTFADMIQRNFPDDGRGDGFLIRGAPNLNNPASLLNLVVPVAKQTVLSRKQNTVAFDGLIAIGERELKRPLWEASCVEYDKEMQRISADETLAFAALMSFSLQNSLIRQESARQLRDALLTASALTRFRLVAREYPQSLDELVPKYLPAIPPDRYTGKPIRYIRDAGRPILYSIGNDRTDDGGKAGIIATSTLDGTKSRPWHGFIRSNQTTIDGDLILFPVQPMLDPIERVED